MLNLKCRPRVEDFLQCSGNLAREMLGCKEWQGNFTEYLISQKYGRLLIFFCRHKDSGLVLEEYARLNFAAGKVRNTSKWASR